MPRTMEGSSFATQSNALFRKNLAFQKRNIKTNFCLVLFPVLVCGLLIVIQIVVDGELNGPENKCGCRCVDESNKDTKNCEKICGIEYSTLDQVFSCAIPNPPQWPPFLQVPRQEFRAVRTPTADDLSPAGLPEETCRQNRTCPVTVLYTGQDRIFATNVSQSFFPESNPVDGSSLDILETLSYFTLGTDTDTEILLFLEPGFFSPPIYNILSSCNATGSDFDRINIPLIGNSSINLQNDVVCTEARNVWSENSSIVNDALFKGYRKSNKEGLINEIMTAYDFLNSSSQNFNLEIWYNASLRRDALIGGGGPPELLRINRAINTVSNAYLQTIKGSLFRILFKFIKEMPKPATKLSLDFSSLIGPIFFTWIVELLLPVFLTYLVYEKQQKLRIMMKMHGLGDGAYWLISYGYFLLISMVYILLFIVFGSLIGLKYFTLNNRGIQFVFFFSYINLQIALAFLLATRFSHVKTAQGLAYIYVFGSGLVASFLFQVFIEDTTFARHWLILMELIPAFSLYRGLYEFGQYAFKGDYMGTSGMTWSDLSDGENGMAEVLIIITIEWSLFLSLAYFLDQFASSGGDFRRDFCNHFLKKKLALASTSQKFEENEAKVNIELEKPDIVAERMIVENIIRDGSTNYAVVADNLKKTYPGRDGNPKKLAVKDLSLALPLGECFGFLGPNGAGKSSFINMMIGLVSPTSGNAVVRGHSILTNMNQIYTNMGVCPQHDLLWEMLTGREHLLFYGRLKNLKGSTLLEAVEESLRSVNLLNGGVADKKAGKYSGGMKRRLSVAISLIGDPKVVYMDEPSTGLDPASRNSLWNAVKAAKRNRAIILTTHSMEEAEVLCDRLGIFVNGTMQCIGNAKQLRARYGGSYIFTMTTSGTEAEQQVENLVLQLSPNAQKIYQISGTQKFEIPKHDVKISDIFKSVEDAKKKFSIQAWGISDTTLEDVFIKVAKTEDSINV